VAACAFHVLRYPQNLGIPTAIAPRACRTAPARLEKLSAQMSLTSGTDQVSVLRMSCHPAPNKRAKRTYVKAAVLRVVQGIPCNCASDSLTLILLGHHGVEEDDGVVGELVRGDAGERTVDPRLITAPHRVVSDCHAHSRPLCQKAIGFLIRTADCRFTEQRYAADRGGHLDCARGRRDVKYNEGARLDPSQMGGGRRSGGKIAIGGGAGLIILLVALLFGINPGDILGGAPQAGPEQSENPSQFAQCTRGSDINADRDCRFVAYTNSIQDYWKDNLQGYQTIQVITFPDSVNTACGHATSAVGPFYCPADTTVYLDLGFFDQLMSQLGAQGGDAAEAYVLAHEFGHHVQNLVGTMQRVQSSGQKSGPTSPAVRLELQADCYAGVWFRHATEDPQSPISEVTQEDLRRAVDAAQAVGDDRIQEKMQGQVSPESWTHGSAAMRREWLAQGFNTGDPNKCDTFARNALN
jgi:predicted metalloprotease